MHDEGRWEVGRGPHESHYGDQRDFVGRQNDGHYTEGSRRSGGYGPGQPSGSFAGGYGAGNYESGNWRAESEGSYGNRPRGSQGGFQGSGNIGSNVGAWGSGGFGSGGYAGGYGREFAGGEGRWSGSQQSGSYTNPQHSGTQFGGQYGGWQYGGPSTGAGSFAGRGPRNYQRSDDRIREDVNERLTADARIDASDIEVRVQNGEVTLSGTVNDGRTRRLAEEIIEDMPGVRDVHNDLRVNRGQWGSGGDQSRHREVGEQSRGREDGAIGHSGNPQTREDVTTINTKEAKK
jgi:hypothetical protein